MTRLIAQILISLATLGYGFVTIKADFNATHASNPLWTPHARFHVVWQILSYSGIGIIALGLIWLPGQMATERIYLAAGLAAAVYGAFYVALAARPIYGGGTHDTNGYQPFTPPGMPGKWDVNITVFTVFAILLVIGALLV